MIGLRHAIPLLLLVCALLALAVYLGQRQTPGVSSTTPAPPEITYLPLGDSYTIGESVNESERWPNQLVKRLKDDGLDVRIVANPAVTGYTAQDLIDNELSLVQKHQPRFVSLQIGVNDYVQGVEVEVFSQQLSMILDRIQADLKVPGNILLVTIPDYGKTPRGQQFGAPDQTEAGIRAFNQVIEQQARSRGLSVADVYAVSQLAAVRPSLVASDGLHPSGEQYKLWTDIMYKSLRQSDMWKGLSK